MRKLRIIKFEHVFREKNKIFRVQNSEYKPDGESILSRQELRKE